MFVLRESGSPISFTISRKRIDPAPLLDQRLPALRHKAKLHSCQGSADQPMGA